MFGRDAWQYCPRGEARRARHVASMNSMQCQAFNESTWTSFTSFATVFPTFYFCCVVLVHAMLESIHVLLFSFIHACMCVYMSVSVSIMISGTFNMQRKHSRQA